MLEGIKAFFRGRKSSYEAEGNDDAYYAEENLDTFYAEENNNTYNKEETFEKREGTLEENEEIFQKIEAAFGEKEETLEKIEAAFEKAEETVEEVETAFEKAKETVEEVEAAFGKKEEASGENEKYEKMVRQLQEKLGDVLQETAVFDVATSRMLTSVDKEEKMFDARVCDLVRTISELHIARSEGEEAAKPGEDICRTAVYRLEDGRYCVMAIAGELVWVMMLDKEYGRPGMLQAELLKEIWQLLEEV